MKMKFLDDRIFSLMDQAFVSVLNFGSIFVLSKITDNALFSDFVIAYSYSVFTYLFSSLFISSPILVFFSKRWKKFGKSYIGICLTINVLSTFLLTSILFYFLEKQIDNIQFYAFFLLCIGISTYDILKKVSYSIKSGLIGIGLLSSILLNVLFFGLLFLNKEVLDLHIIFIIYGVAFLGISVLFGSFVYSHKTFKRKQFVASKASLKFYKLVFKNHYHYSKWLILGGLVFWAYNQGIYILAKYLNFSDNAIGKVRLIQNLTGVFTILTITMENYYKPEFSIQKKGALHLFIMKTYKKTYKKILILFLIAFPVGILVYQTIYADKFGDAYFLFALMLCVQFMLVGLKLLSIALKAKEITKPFFFAHILALIGMLFSLKLLKDYIHDRSIVLSYFIANFIFCTFVFYSYFKLGKKG